MGEEDDGEEKEKSVHEKIVSGLKFRSIGPAFASGRIADFAVNPNNPSEYYIAVASGNIWKTTNAGTTFEPIFEKYGSYSIGCLALDPKNPNVIWAGTGENNHQRALGYGDGVYKSIDGGQNWENMGLKDSRHIGMIAIHPDNTDIVYVAAEGSTWGPGGDRGLYKTTDGGKTWEAILTISENTGINNVMLDPRNPDIIYATSEQRRRHTFTKIGGGPESGIHKSIDGGNTWKKLKKGLPKGDIGGIGIAISPVNPDVIYAIIEAAEDNGGFFRSTNRGETWTKRSDHHSSGQYYNEIFCDPGDIDKVYSVETRTKVTMDGGKTFKKISGKNRHVDDHALWINPNNTDHFIIGGDGGIYESYDGGETYQFKTNLPVTQFYRVGVDNSYPFYFVYGGTQDNNSMGGPSRNLSSEGVSGDEWFITNGGDGFWTAADPEDPNIVYAEAQYGNMVRYDRRSGESIRIRPEPGKNELSYKWNWNTPLIISPHSNTRLYTAANKVFRSDDRGNSWKVISDDITSGTDRNTWKVMDKFWSIDAVAKDVSTSLWGTAVSLAESPVKENLLYVGTDDGVLQRTEDAGNTWVKLDLPEVPEYTYVSDIFPSNFDKNTVYVTFDNRKRDDFKPYVFKSTDKGNTWKSISSNLPENGTVHTIAEDHVKPGLLFAGTEFGIFVTLDDGKKWIQVKSGIPTISVKDMAIQQRENALVLATFGRGFYVLDDYSPLQKLNERLLEKEAHIFAPKEALIYIQERARYGRGSTYYTAKNPPYGAVFNYYLKERPKTKKQTRKEKEKELFKKGEPIAQPDIGELREEKHEEKPHLLFVISDDKNNDIRVITAKAKEGLGNVSWDLRAPSPYPVRLKDDKYDPLDKETSGILVAPGKYHVTMYMSTDGKLSELTSPVEFTVKDLENSTLPAENMEALVAFRAKAADMARKIMGSEEYVEELLVKISHIKESLNRSPALLTESRDRIRELEDQLQDIHFRIVGQKPKASREEIPPSPVPLMDRVRTLMWTQYRSTSPVIQKERDALDILHEEYPPLAEEIGAIAGEIESIEKELENVGAPYTPGRSPLMK
jgi:photosystem II stability/assembly factor-like uncharacterized protein